MTVVKFERNPLQLVARRSEAKLRKEGGVRGALSESTRLESPPHPTASASLRSVSAIDLSPQAGRGDARGIAVLEHQRNSL